MTGGTVCVDFDTFGDNENAKPELFLNEEWAPNITNKVKFLEYDNIVKFGEMYPDYVKDIIGENKVAYTPKDNPAYIVFVAKTDKVPKNFEGKFTELKITWWVDDWVDDVLNLIKMLKSPK